jgi:glycyl-tRNA synthetase
MDRKELVIPAKKMQEVLRGCGMRVDYDISGSIGRRYRRNDEVGTPYDVTVDYETLEQGTVTIRDRDSMSQVKVPLAEVAEKLQSLLCGSLKFQEAGTLVMPAKKE